MVSYQTFLFLLSQINSKDKFSFEISGRSFFLEPSERKNFWKLSTPLSEDDLAFCPIRRELKNQQTSFCWQSREGGKVRWNEELNAVVLIQEFLFIPKYLFFKAMLSQFLSQCSDWEYRTK